MLGDQNFVLSLEKARLQREIQGLILNLEAALSDRNLFQEQARLTGIQLDLSLPQLPSA